MTKFEEDMLLVGRELRKLNTDRYTGQANISLQMSQGGISKISLRLDRDLKTPQKTS